MNQTCHGELIMANKRIFGNTVRNYGAKPTSVVNEAGGRAYSQSAEATLAQLVVTGCLNNTYYANADEQLDAILANAAQCSTAFLANAAVYARKTARMKDTPALLTAILTTRGEEGLVALQGMFHKAIDNQKQLRNFVQIVRSGKVGRKSMGTAVKRLVQNWIRNQDANDLFRGSVGNAPSLADVVKMAHVKPANAKQNAFFGWLIGKEYNKRNLPSLVKEFEAYKADPTSNSVPEVDFRMLTALNLGTAQWSEIARNASWNMLRMNLNTFARHGCFDDKKLVDYVANKLADANEVSKHNVFPYQLLTTFKAVEGTVPVKLSNALQDAMEYATQNVPEFTGRVAVAIDVSGSMSSAVTGDRKGSTTKTTCVDVAGLIAACILRKNEDALIIPFDTSVRSVNLNPRDSVMTNAGKLAMHGGGTACQVALEHMIAAREKCDLVIYVSDNQSWYRNAATNNGYGVASATAQFWEKYRNTINRKAKMVCIDLQPYGTVQVEDSANALNIGGFSDSVFEVIERFAKGYKGRFADVIGSVAE